MSSQTVTVVIVMSIVFSLVGMIIGQYLPFTGGSLVQIAEPFSPIRTQNAAGYIVVGGIIGTIYGFYVTKPKKKDEPEDKTSATDEEGDTQSEDSTEILKRMEQEIKELRVKLEESDKQASNVDEAEDD